MCFIYAHCQFLKTLFQFNFRLNRAIYRICLFFVLVHGKTTPWFPMCQHVITSRWWLMYNILYTIYERGLEPMRNRDTFVCILNCDFTGTNLRNRLKRVSERRQHISVLDRLFFNKQMKRMLLTGNVLFVLVHLCHEMFQKWCGQNQPWQKVVGMCPTRPPRK